VPEGATSTAAVSVEAKAVLVLLITYLLVILS
jgi:hypothetical protein